MSSGYTPCKCRDCFEIAISDDDTVPELCNTCVEHGCNDDDCSECQAPSAYGGYDEEE